MTKFVVGTSAGLNMSTNLDLTTVVGYDVVASGAKQVELESGPFTATLRGSGFGDPDSNGLPQTGLIKKVTLEFSGAPVFTLSGMGLTVEDLRAFAEANDPEGLRAQIFAGKDQIYGGDGGDNLLGYAGNDLIEGGLGKDAMDGGAGKDLLIGGAGRDTMTGGTEDDTFKFREIGDSSKKASDADHITDLQANDVIDLRGIDANELKDNNNTFELVQKFTHEAGQATLKYQAGANETLLMLDTNGDAKADMIIVLDGGDFRDHDAFVF